MSNELAADFRLTPRAPRAQREFETGYADGYVESSVLWRILWLRRVWIAVICAVLLTAAAFYCAVTPALYTATSQILVDPRDKQVVTNDVNPSMVAPDGGVTQVESQVEVLQSSGVLLRAIASTALDEDPEFNGSGSMGVGFSFLRGLFSRGAEDQTDDVKARTLANLRKRLVVKRADKVLVLDLGVTSKDPEKAARIANAIADAYLADQAQARSDAGLQASKSLTSRLSELQTRLRNAENAVEDYRAANKLVASGGQLVSDQQINELTAQLSTAQSRTSALKAQIDERDRNPQAVESTTEAIQSPVIAKLRENESALVQKVADLGAKLGPLHPDFTSAESQLRRVRQLIARETERIGRAVRSDYERALADERALASHLDRLKSKSLDTDKIDVKLHELQREADASRALYTSFLSRAKETAELAGVDSTNARVITRAMRPIQRAWPPVALLLLGALVAGAGLGVGLTLLHAYLAPLVMSPEQIRAFTDARVLGVIPAGGRPGGRGLTSGKRPSPEGSASRMDPVSNRVVQVLLANLTDIHPGAAGNFLSRSLVVTSAPTDSAQRVRVAEMIAAAAARNGDTVLFVDADVSDGQASEAPGFLDLMRGDCTLNAAIHPAANASYKRMEKGRNVAGSQSLQRADAEGSQFARAIQGFDLTVIDGGCIAENYSLAQIAAGADELLLVAELSKTPLRSVAEAAEAASLMRASLTGAVLVDTSLRA